MEKIHFEPVHKTLLDEDGKVVKQLCCPQNRGWEQLQSLDAERGWQRYCGECDARVLDTAVMSPDEVLATVRSDASVCLRISLEQDNVEVKVGRG